MGEENKSKKNRGIESVIQIYKTKNVILQVKEHFKTVTNLYHIR